MKTQERVFREKCVRPRAGLIGRLAGLSCFWPRLVLLALVLSAAEVLIPSRPPAVRAVTCTTNPVVQNNGDSGAGSLRQAIIDACDGDTITFGNTVTSPITLTTADLVIDKNLTINGPGATLLTVERSSAAGTPQFRIFTINSGVTVIISGLTVTNGRTPDGIPEIPVATSGGSGGGIFNAGTLTLTNSIISGNSTGNGGGDSDVDGNGGSGGGISNAGTTTLTNSTISGNSTGNGGSSSGASGNGGSGAGIDNSGTLTLIGATVSGNSTGIGGESKVPPGNGGNGGGINNSGTLTLIGATVSGNSTGIGGVCNHASPAGSGGSGGGIFNGGNSLIVTNSTISGNSTGNGGNGAVDGGSGGSGGGIFSGGNSLTVTNGTISGNSTGNGGSGNSTLGGSGGSGGVGGGIYANGAAPSIRASIIALNSAPVGPDIDGTVTSQSHNLVGKGDGSTGFTNGVNNDQVGSIASPLDPKLGPLANNGGLTLTHVLLAGSPAIDAGDDSVLGGPLFLTTDQRGAGFPRKYCTHVDIGAFEISSVPSVSVPSNISANSDPGMCSASVNFTTSATDACDGAIVPTCKIGGTVISSPHNFPVGSTTVICSATDSSGLTGSNSFTVSVSDTNAPMVKCPGNIAVYSDPGKSTALVALGASATDICDGSLTPVYKIGTTVITSPYNFPPGVTTVTASATDSHGLSAMCSFTVTVTLLDICIQDSISGDTFRFSSQTGAYLYTRCRDNFTLTGTGIVRVVGGVASLTDSKPDRRINAAFLLGQLTGRANITMIPAPGVYQTILVNDTNPYATCTCP